MMSTSTPILALTAAQITCTPLWTLVCALGLCRLAISGTRHQTPLHQPFNVNICNESLDYTACILELNLILYNNVHACTTQSLNMVGMLQYVTSIYQIMMEPRHLSFNT